MVAETSSGASTAGMGTGDDASGAARSRFAEILNRASSRSGLAGTVGASSWRGNFSALPSDAPPVGEGASLDTVVADALEAVRDPLEYYETATLPRLAGRGREARCQRCCCPRLLWQRCSANPFIGDAEAFQRHLEQAGHSEGMEAEQGSSWRRRLPLAPRPVQQRRTP